MGTEGKESLPGIYPILDEVVTESLKLLADPANLPAIIICKTGRAQSSAVIACLRKLQKWSLMSIYEEFRRYSGLTRLQQQYEQFIELYDIEQIEIKPECSQFIRR